MKYAYGTLYGSDVMFGENTLQMHLCTACLSDLYHGVLSTSGNSRLRAEYVMQRLCCICLPQRMLRVYSAYIYAYIIAFCICPDPTRLGRSQIQHPVMSWVQPP